MTTECIYDKESNMILANLPYVNGNLRNSISKSPKSPEVTFSPESRDFEALLNQIYIFFSIILNQTASSRSQRFNTAEAILRYFNWPFDEPPLSEVTRVFGPLHSFSREVRKVQRESEEASDPFFVEEVLASKEELKEKEEWFGLDMHVKSQVDHFQGLRQVELSGSSKDRFDGIRRCFRGYYIFYRDDSLRTAAISRLDDAFKFIPDRLAALKFTEVGFCGMIEPYQKYISFAQKIAFGDHPVYPLTQEISASSATVRSLALNLANIPAIHKILPYVLTAFILNCEKVVKNASKLLNSPPTKRIREEVKEKPSEDTKFITIRPSDKEGKEAKERYFIVKDLLLSDEEIYKLKKLPTDDDFFVHQALKALSSSCSTDNFTYYLKRLVASLTRITFVQEYREKNHLSRHKMLAILLGISPDSVNKDPDETEDVTRWIIDGYQGGYESIRYHTMLAAFTYSLCVLACMQIPAIHAQVDYALSEKLFNHETMAFYTLCGPFSDVESAEFRSAARIYDYYYNSVEFINGTPYDRSRNNFYKDIPVFYDNEFYVPLKYLFDDKHFWEHFKTMSFARNEYMDSLLACGINPDLLPDELNDLNEHSQANAIIAAYMLHPYNQQDQDWYNMLTRLRLIHKVFGSDFEILSESE